MASLSSYPQASTILILHGTEEWGQCRRWYTEYGPDYWDSWCQRRGVTAVRVSVAGLSQLLTDQKPMAVINPFGEAYPEEDSETESTLKCLAEYVAAGGILVCTGGWPFYYAHSPDGVAKSGSRLERFFSVDVNDEQWWPDVEGVDQPAASLRKYGNLALKGDDLEVHVWRPIREKYGVVEKVLVSHRRDGVVLGLVPKGRGNLVVAGMHLVGDSEVAKLSAILEMVLLPRTTRPSKAMESRAAEAIARMLRAADFKVELSPRILGQSFLPSAPDLLARRDDEVLAIEVKVAGVKDDAVPPEAGQAVRPVNLLMEIQKGIQRRSLLILVGGSASNSLRDLCTQEGIALKILDWNLIENALSSGERSVLSTMAKRILE